MSRCLSILMLVLAFTSCRRLPPNEVDYKDRVLMQFDTDEFSQVVWDYVTELKYDRRLHLENAMVCFDGHSKLRLQFSTQLIIEMCEARELLVDVAEGLLDKINHNKGVASLLDPYPLTADQLEIYIDFQSYYGLYADPFYIGWVVLEDGMAYYYAFTLKNTKLNSWEVRSEPYFKSRSFVFFEREAEKKYKEAHPVKTIESILQERYIVPTNGSIH